jgi:hypothetical protein
MTGFAMALHWSLAWVFLPLCAVLALSGALRTDLHRAWRIILLAAALLTTAALGLRGARHGLVHWDIPAGIWIVAPLLFFMLMAQTRQAIWPMPLLLGAAVVACMGSVALLLRWLFGVEGLRWANDALLLAALPLLAIGLIKHMRTPAIQPLASAPPASPPPSEDVRQAMLDQRLSSDEAQEAADKYTRE